MRFPQLGVRHRILAACLIISLSAVGAMAIFGFSLRSVLRARARASCICVAELFADQAHQRLINLAGETAVLASLFSRIGATATPDAALPALDARLALCSWAVYDDEGRRRLGQRSAPHDQALERAGIGTQRIIERERGRFADARAGKPSTVLVPGGDLVYALVYRPIRRADGRTDILQAATLAAGADFQGQAHAEVRAVLRPFVEAADEPHLVTVGGLPRMVVHRPLTFCGRQLGTVSAAVPYDAEARCAQGAAVAILFIVAGSALILAVLSYLLTDVAMVPLEQVRSFIEGHQCGIEVERPSGLPDDAIGSLFEAYHEMIDQSQVFADQLMESNRALRDLLTGSVGALVNAVEANDGYTAGHSQRVADMACAIARQLGWSRQEIEQLRLGALLHDIGKIGISQDILNKPGSLDPGEWEIIRQHPVIGARILSAIPNCEDIARTVLYHHEYVDGSGYPEGLRGEAIPPAARLVAVADIYDALTSKRSYRDAYDPAAAAAIVEESAGTMLDPDMVAVFLELLRKRHIAGPDTPLREGEEAQLQGAKSASVGGMSPSRDSRRVDTPPTMRAADPEPVTTAKGTA